VETSAGSRELPMACSLKKDEWDERMKLIEGIASAGVENVQFESEVLAFQFSSDLGLREALEGLIRLEGECCPFLEFGLDEHDSSLTLTVRAPNGPATALDAVRDMFVSPSE
jgi:hypothetical protein